MPVFSADPARIDVALVHRWLSEESYWAKGRPRATQDVAMAGSRNYGVYDEATGAQLAYARVVTDGALFAWLCDVFVAPSVRGTGVGKLLLQGVLDDLEPLGLKRMLLATADAQELYRRFGFTELSGEMAWMIRQS
ncbi:GNAT family N-acetyltransferase [Microbacterium sp.]|uniref:GNAT family N-acetyltransferase n=1 Tax=Microbacterium sp. TaxID=51671 RepID=UPI00289B4B35|nr:GNAT family N-acetyltransferase [Microbacterium sp.]